MSYQSMKVTELKAELKKLGLETTGKKEELVQRLIKNDSKGKGKGKKTVETSDDDGADDGGDADGADDGGDADGAGDDGDGDGDGGGVVPGTKRKKSTSSTIDEAEDEGEASNKRMKKSAPSSDAILANLTDEQWKSALTPEFTKPYFKKILEFLKSEIASGAEIFPPQNEVFCALNHTPLEKVKVVILGQDPYHDNNQANGLCFSVRDGIKHPPSLKNIFKELEKDIPGFKTPKSGSLVKWADRGVLLLNATLTVKAHTANSHSKCGWLTFTDAIIEVLNKKTKGVVFILWGNFAQKKGKIIDRSKHFVIEAAHPSPLSVTKFMGCKVFSKANDILKKENLEGIDWTL